MINNALLTESVYDELKAKIINNEYPSGQRLDINSIAEEFGVSRTPVVSALKALERDGYVTVKPRSGSYVREYTAEEVAALYDFRLAVERLAMRTALLKADSEKIRNFLEQFEDAYTRISTSGADEIKQIMNVFFDVQLEFHCYLISLSPQIIGDSLKNLIDLTKRTGKMHIALLLKDPETHRDELKKEVSIHICMAKAVLSHNADELQKRISEDQETTKNFIINYYKAKC